jgi:5'-deoxynucleotidase YfbR-like HD superfamily hydrolase
MEQSELARVMELRKGANVRRYHTERIIGEQTVGHHSHGVAMLLVQYFPHMCRPNVIIACLTHDLAEGYVGDIPAPAKWDNPELGELLDKIEAKRINDLGLRSQLSDSELEAVKVCDYLESLLFAHEQLCMGNTLFGPVLRKLVRWFEQRTSPIPSGMSKLVQEVIFASTVGGTV